METRSRFKVFADKVAVESEPGLTGTQLMLTNHDLKPVEKERRQWGPWNFVGFWIADSFNINTWMISSAMIVNGLSWWQAWLCVWIGYSITGIFVVINARPGAVYHISFPVINRSSFGIWGALWPVLNRAAMACVWYGVQAYIGGNCVYLMIRSIWKSWENVPNTFSEDAGTDTAHFASFIIFWVCSLPALWFPVHQLRHLFTAKAYVVPVAGITFLAWTISRAGGIGPIIKQPNTVHGGDLAWEIVKGIMSSISNFATLIVNASDFSRFAQKPRDALWSQLVTIPMGFAITSFIGIIVSSASTTLYGKAIWNPLDLLDEFINDGNSAEHFGVFFIASSFTLAQLGTNLAANSVSCGNDLTALLPRWINIRRGSYFCACMGLVICPWQLLKDSNQFTTYLSAYSVFLSSIAGVMICDYYIVRKGYIDVKELYDGRKEGPYYYTAGFNWRGYAAYICGIVINVVGFADAVGAKNVPIGAVHVYQLNYFCGFGVSMLVYYTLCRLWPVAATSDRWMEVGDEIDDMRLAYDSRSPSYDEENATGQASKATEDTKQF
ncbi:putative permease C29B12.14c [Fusarium venenatum]|uniref:Uracil permease n=1 Tax=Fusarium venenatum TaxID=56646 RepID=A0A2L2TTN7_9HYPO|nr:uncharacterized protein FVRRES_08984 [Fusarium venenatum]KAG8349864.1 putative permease C29B12.14c [Fusarium venenatum]CEI68907.1 unnamed protein product [Fusarium venenatum]